MLYRELNIVGVYLSPAAGGGKITSTQYFLRHDRRHSDEKVVMPKAMNCKLNTIVRKSLDNRNDLLYNKINLWRYFLQKGCV